MIKSGFKVNLFLLYHEKEFRRIDEKFIEQAKINNIMLLFWLFKWNYREFWLSEKYLLLLPKQFLFSTGSYSRLTVSFWEQ